MAIGSRDDEARRGGGPRAIAAMLPRVAGAALRRHGFAGPTGAAVRVVSDWPAIIGEELARVTMPERLSFPRGAAATSEPGGVLRIRAAGPLALELQHLEPLVIERINRYFGYRAVARLAFVQAPPAAPMPKRGAAPPAEIAPEEARRLADSLAGIEDETLRAALRRLGRAVAAASPKRG